MSTAQPQPILWTRTLPGYLLAAAALLAMGTLALGLGDIAKTGLLMWCGIVAVYAPILFLISRQRVAAARALMEKPRLRWQYDDATWNLHVADYRRRWARYALIMLGLGLALGVTFFVVERFKPDAVTEFGVGAIVACGIYSGGFAGAMYAAAWTNSRRMLSAPREALLGVGIYIPGAFHPTGGRLFDVAVEGSDPAWFHFSYVVSFESLEGGAVIGETPVDTVRKARIPIPRGKEAEAARIQSD